MRFQLLALLAVFLFVLGGCDKSNRSNTKENSNNHTGESGHKHEHGHEDGHAHNHDAHHPAHGPHEGHLFSLDSDDYVGEWQKFKDSNLIRMHILNKDHKSAPLKVDRFEVIPMAGNDPTPFVLTPESPDADGKTSVYSLDDQDLTIAIPLGVTIKIRVGDQVIEGKIDPHTPMDH